ncbi:MAG: hypothetical protein WCH84_05425 [Verrucomicrobiota bacterium]
MEERTYPNCNVDVEKEELKRNNLCCPTCGFDLSESGEVDDLVEESDDDDDDEKE